MDRVTVFLLTFSTAGIVVGAAAAQDTSKSQLTARELYYAAAEAPAKQAAPAAKPAVKPAATNSASTSTKTTAKPPKADSTNIQTAPTTIQTASATIQSPPTMSRPSQGGELPGGAHIVAASTAPAPASGPALGLKYAILKEVGSEYVEVAPDTVFHAGDHIRFKVESNCSGYLYIVSLGSTGRWAVTFPDAHVDNGSNRIDGFRSYTMPPNSRMTFDENAGEEKLFIVLSREPEQDLESIIYSLQGATTKPVAEPTTPAPTKHQTLIASASIGDSTIGRLRNAYTRDLIVETITDQTPGDRKENAVYVVNPTGSKDSRVVADLTLIHR